MDGDTLNVVDKAILQRWLRGEPIAAATVVRTSNSAPLPAGATMYLTQSGTVVGGVSGGCVEAAVCEIATLVLDDGCPRIERFGIADDAAFEVGLTCGGTIEVFVQRIDRDSFPEFFQVASRSHEPVTVATVVRSSVSDRVGLRLLVRDDQVTGSLGTPALDSRVVDELSSIDGTTLRRYHIEKESGDEVTEVFISVRRCAPRMIVFGAVDFAAAVAGIGSFLGYHVTVCDARPTFATSERFSIADDVVVQWPHRYLQAERDAGRLDGRTVLVALTHDAKFDIPLLRIALRSEGWLQRPAYVGALGSRRTHADRCARLREMGMTDQELGLLRAPIGLNLRAVTAEETAVSIAAEIIAHRYGGDGRALTSTMGAIHPVDTRNAPAGLVPTSPGPGCSTDS
ncbi:xanthine dehydrogenase accessory factor [Rhodococcus opacus M213]|uniref:Xanthine dehydrogenase accessory factor n=1 Tax=Rhodococcus opacus M213 TaxID=1129896 RepID=K8X6V2_RHOOP|nr:xanthine dehydrogenase accessory factor [Rhodococcus opacus M213]